MGKRLGMAAVGLGLLGLLAALFWRGAPGGDPGSEAVPARAATASKDAAPPAPPAPPDPSPTLDAPVAAGGLDAAPHGHDEARSETHIGAPGGVAAGHPTAAPALEKGALSDIPHQLLRSWSRPEGSGSTGVAGVMVIVDPRLAPDDLDQLIRDIRERHLDTPIFHAEVYDSLEAVTYDPHSDGGTMRDRHLVASATRNAHRGLDVVKVRGVTISP